MKNSNLKLNVLTFAWPQVPFTFYFSESPSVICKKLHYTQYPDNIETLFPGITADRERSLYTTFDHKTEEGKPLSMDFMQGNHHLLKRYFNSRIREYFQSLSHLVKVDFVHDNQIWLPQPALSTSEWDVYEKYTLKIQFCQVSEFPELVVTYDGTSKILKQSVSELIDAIGSGGLKWIYHNQKLHPYTKMVDWGFDEFNTARPVLNFNLLKLLEWPVEIPRACNKYKKHQEKIEAFIATYLASPDFMICAPLHSHQLLTVRPASISQTRSDSNLLLFAGGKTSRVPYLGMSNYGPYRPPKWRQIELMYIVHEEDTKLANDFHTSLKKGENNYKGLASFARVDALANKKLTICFQNRDYPVSEAEARLRDMPLDPEVRYIAIYLTPWGKDEQHPQRRMAYPHMKELMLKYNITLQCVEVEKLKNKNGYFHYNLTNMAVAMLAKLDGVPWRLNTPAKNELIIGVGAFRHYDANREYLQYLGSAFSFDNTGSFNSFKYFLKHETELLAGSIAHAVRQFATHNKHIERLIVHFYKVMSEKELQPIEYALQNLGLDIPVFIVSINKTESKDLVAFDTGYVDLMPLSGTYINIGRNRYLLFNNTRYNDFPQRVTDGFPFPVKLAIDCTHKELLSETGITGELIEQVYQFSRLYYKSVRQQGLPITIKYPEILARIAPNFRDEGMPAAGEDSLWFL